MEKKERRKIKPFNVKQEAVEQFLSGKETEESLCAKHGIISKTLRFWQQQVKRSAPGYYLKPKLSDAERKKAVREILGGMITIPEAVVKYGVNHRSVIRSWIKKFSADLPSLTPLAMPISPEEQEELSKMQERCKLLETALAQANLQITGLETMIDIAEKELQIDIRKKSGTRQS
jgi:transposase